MKFLVVALASLSALASVSYAQAETYVVNQTVSPYIACYVKEYVPAKVLVNTRGKLVKGASQGWEVTGNQWNIVRSPGVYIQTQRTIEPDHYKLVPANCH